MGVLVIGVYSNSVRDVFLLEISCMRDVSGPSIILCCSCIRWRSVVLAHGIVVTHMWCVSYPSVVLCCYDYAGY